MTIRLSIALTSQPLSTNSTASQSSSSGWVGQAPCEPKSSSVVTSPWPKASFQSRLTNTRAVSGFSRATSQRARSSRVARRSVDVQRRQRAPARRAARPAPSRPASCRAAGPGPSGAASTSMTSVRGNPAVEQSLIRRSSSASSFFCSGDGFLTAVDRVASVLEPAEGGGLLGSREPRRLLAADDRLLHVGEEGGEAVELAGGERVELVVVALGAAHGRAQPDRRDVAHPVGGVLGHVLLGLGPALLGRLEQPVVARGDPRLVGRPSGSRSPASCSIVNRSNGLLALKASDHVVAERARCRRGCRCDSPCVSANRTRSSQETAIRSP